MNSLNVNEYFEAVSPTTMSEVVDRIVKDLALIHFMSELSGNRLGLDKILESLEMFLTSKETQKRAKAAKLLTEMITKLPEQYLLSSEIDLFTTYLCSKLEDHYSVSIPSLPALQHLLQIQQVPDTKSNFITKEKSILIIRTILKDIHVQSMVQNDRMLVFTMCQFVLSREPLVATIIDEKYATDFVYGFIQAVDGEKDPRNLLICFDCIRTICHKLNLGPFVEEMFEVFACYFPIDFTPPKNESFVITKEMLIKSLRNCFAAKKEFSKFAIPLLLEKFHSNVEEAHLDAIQTFAQCSRETYDPNDYSDYIESLWSFCQKTVLNTSKSELEEAALDAIEAMVFSISRSVQAANFRAGELKPTAVSIDSFTEKAMQNPVKYLNEPDLKLVWPSVKCLHALAKGSSTSNLIVTKRCIPILIEYFNTATQQNQRKTYLDILWQFVENSQKFDKKPSPVLKENIDNLLKICINNGLNKHLTLACLTGIQQLLCFDGLIGSATQTFDTNNNETSNYFSIAKFFWHPLWMAEHTDSTELSPEKKKTVGVFYTMSKSDRSVMDWLLAAVSETLTNSGQSGSYIVAIEIVKTLSDLIAKDHSLVDFVLAQMLLSIFEQFLRGSATLEMPLEFLLHVLNGLVATVEAFSRNKSVYGASVNVLTSIVETSLKLVVSHCGQFVLPGTQKNRSAYEIILRFSFLFRIYASNMKVSDEKSEEFLQSLSIFSDNVNGTFMPLELESSVDQKMTITILAQIFSNLDRIAFRDEVLCVFDQLKGKLVTLATRISVKQAEEDQQQINQVACQFYASLLNKLQSDSAIDAELELVKETLVKAIEEENSDLDYSHRCLDLWTWITKALVMREHKAAEFFTSKLIDWLDILVLSEKCSGAFGTILDNEPREYSFMTNKAGAQMRLLYRQRFFNKAIHKLKENFDSEIEAKKGQKMFYMMAIINMVNYLPKAIVQQHIKMMMPVLLYSLNIIDGKNEQLLLNSLKSFEMLINESEQEKGQYFLEFIEQVLERLLRMCSYKQSMNIRLLALKCINNLALNVAPNRLIKSQKAVVKGLELCLNDNKRVCRQLAVEARNRWYLITTKTNEN